jgi:23S rRNA maturation mini-RNase III
MPDISVIIPSHEWISKPFIEKADRIISNLNALEKEQRRNISENEILKLMEKFSRVKDYSIPNLSIATGHQFSHPELFLFIFLYRDINDIFNRASTNPVNGSKELLSPAELRDMEMVSEDRLTLAYIGDAALEAGILFTIWPPENDSIPPKAYLHAQRERLVPNGPLARFWDSLDLYDGKTLLNPVNDNVETKGSYMEAVMGIIYLDGGLPAVEKAMHTLRKYLQKDSVGQKDTSKFDYQKAVSRRKLLF